MNTRAPSRSDPANAPRFAQERQQEIAGTLRTQGRVEVTALAKRYGVSEDTIRRDLRLLAAQGLVQKTHGGAVALNAAVMRADERVDVLAHAKRAIAHAAARHVHAHHTLFIDGGSTALALARLLCAPDMPRPLTVVTPSLDAACALADAEGVRLVLAGGAWRPELRIFSGPQALATVASHRADLALLGACAVQARVGLTAADADDAALKRQMIAGAARCIVLADASKLDTVTPHAVCALADVALVISDAAPAWLRKQVEVERV